MAASCKASCSTCESCKNVYQSPRLLPCLHTFCKECIGTSLTKTVGSKSTICCPTCNSAVPMPPEGVESFPVDLRLENLACISKYGTLVTSQPPPPCDECARDPAEETVSFCCTCVGFLCQHCHLQHKISRKLAVNHKVLLLKETEGIETKLMENLTLPSSTRFCSKHPKEEIKLHCSQCKVSVCMQCALIKHSGHTMEDLSVYIEREKSSLEEIPDVVGKLNGIISSGKSLCKSINTGKENVEHEIDEVFSTLQKCLNDKKAELLEQCSEAATARVAAHSIQIDELVSLKDAVVTLNSFVKNVQECYSEAEYLSVKPTLQCRAKDLKKRVENMPISLFQDESIKFNGDHPAVTNLLSEFRVSATKQHKQRDYTAISTPVMTTKASYPYHIAVHKNGDFFVANYTGGSMEVFNKTGQKERTFPCTGYPLGVTVVRDSLFIVKFTNKVCHKVTLNGELLIVIGTGQLNGPWGCAVSKDSLLYIAEETNNRVQVFNPDGTSQKVLCGSSYVNQPRDVAIDPHGLIHVAAVGSIKVFNPNGTLVREYGKGLSHPSGVAIDPNGFCLVGDWSGHSLHIFNPSGGEIHRIGFSGCNICGVAVDDDLNVYVVNNSSKEIYKY